MKRGRIQIWPGAHARAAPRRECRGVAVQMDCTLPSCVPFENGQDEFDISGGVGAGAGPM